MVVVHSMSLDVPEQLYPVLPAYEERFLCLVLSLLRGPRSRVIYVTSQPIHPRVAGLLLQSRPRAGHAAGTKPVRHRLARRRAERAAGAQAARPPRCDPPHPVMVGDPGGGDHPPVLRHRGRGAARGASSGCRSTAPILGSLARDENGQPARVRGGGRPASRRARARRRARRPARAARAARPEPAGGAGDPQARRRYQRAGKRDRRPRCGGGRPARRAAARGRGVEPRRRTWRRSTRAAGSSRS